jgi:hypothetical protein
MARKWKYEKLLLDAGTGDVVVMSLFEQDNHCTYKPSWTLLLMREQMCLVVQPSDHKLPSGYKPEPLSHLVC